MVNFSDYCLIGGNNLGILEHTVAVVLVIGMLVVLQQVLQQCRVCALDLKCVRWVHTVFAGLTLLSVSVFVYQASLVSGHLMSCGLHTWDIFNMALNFLFFLRVTLVVVEKQEVPPVAAVVDSWLFVHTCWECYQGTHLYGYQFLSVLRLTYPETRNLFTSLVQMHFGCLWEERVSLVTGVLVMGGLMAGALQTVEEWKTAEGIHPDASGQLTLPRTFWDYLFLTFITLTTVGYGDLVPSTAGGKILVVVFIILFIEWLVESCSKICSLFKGFFSYYTNSIPPTNSGARMVVLGCKTCEKLKCLLRCFRSELQEVSTQIIVLLDENLELKISNFRDLCLDYPNLLVLSKTITADVLQKCFPFHDETMTNRLQDRIVVLNDTEASDTRAADSEVFNLVDMAKRRIPSVVMIVQVLLWETREAVMRIQGWGPDDRVLCLEALTAGFMAHSVVVNGAQTILANIISPYLYWEKSCDLTSSTHMFSCSSEARRVLYLCGRAFTLELMPGKLFEINQTFAEAAVQHYLCNQTVLLGYRLNGKGIALLEKEVPAGADRILLSPLMQDEIALDSCTRCTTCEQKQHCVSFIVNTTKKVSIIQDTESGMLRQHLQRYRHLQVSVGDAAPTVVCIEPPMPRQRSIFNLHIKKGELMKRKLNPCLVTNVSQSLRPGLIEHVFTSFITHIFLWPDLSDAWMILVRRADIVEVRISGQCWYDQAFKQLLLEDGLVCLGVMKSWKTWLLPVINPPPAFSLTSDDIIIALKFQC